MVNLIAKREVVRELIQGDFTAANVVLCLRQLMHNEHIRETMKDNLRQVAAQLSVADPGKHSSAIERVARITMELVAGRSGDQAKTISALSHKAP